MSSATVTDTSEEEKSVLAPNRRAPSLRHTWVRVASPVSASAAPSEPRSVTSATRLTPRTPTTPRLARR